MNWSFPLKEELARFVAPAMPIETNRHSGSC